MSFSLPQINDFYSTILTFNNRYPNLISNDIIFQYPNTPLFNLISSLNSLPQGSFDNDLISLFNTYFPSQQQAVQSLQSIQQPIQPFQQPFQQPIQPFQQPIQQPFQQPIQQAFQQPFQLPFNPINPIQQFSPIVINPIIGSPILLRRPHHHHHCCCNDCKPHHHGCKCDNCNNNCHNCN
jgi:hypothetical protein